MFGWELFLETGFYLFLASSQKHKFFTHASLIFVLRNPYLYLMVAKHNPNLSIKTIDLAGPRPPRFSFELFFLLHKVVRFPTRWSDFSPLALLPTKWLDFLPPEVVGNPTNCAPGMETKHCTMGKLFCKSCSRHVLSGSRNCHFHFLFFVLQLLP